MKKRVVDRQRFEHLVNKFADELPKRAVDGSVTMDPKEMEAQLARKPRLEKK